MSAFLLQTSSLSNHFGGLEVLRGLSIGIKKGKITALIGPNGAGKTTLFNVLTGFLKPTSGNIVFDDKSIIGMQPYEIARLGLIRSFQEVRLIRELTVLENIMTALRDRRRETFWSAMFLRKSQKEEDERIRKEGIILLDKVELSDKAHNKASDLSYGQAKLLEITRVKAMKPRLLLLDEPASGLNHLILDKVKGQLLSMKESGITIFLIEHNVPFVMGVADTAIVLNNGEKIFEGEPSRLMEDEKVKEAYLGNLHTNCAVSE